MDVEFSTNDQNLPGASRYLGFIWGSSAYLFNVGSDGWKLSTDKLGVDGRKLVMDNYGGDFIFRYGPQFCAQAPIAKELQQAYAAIGKPIEALGTAEECANQWREMLRKATDT